MDYVVKQSGSLNSAAEDMFVELFCDTFGPDKSQFLFTQYPFTDIYGNRRFIDFALENESIRIAIEIDGETYHNPQSNLMVTIGDTGNLTFSKKRPSMAMLGSLIGILLMLQMRRTSLWRTLKP